MQTLNTKLCSLGLRRRNMDYDTDNVRLRIQQELDGPGCSGGYKWKVYRCQETLFVLFLRSLTLKVWKKEDQRPFLVVARL